MTTLVGDRPRIGVSECLLGRAVRWDGGHKRDVFLCESLAQSVSLVPVCPEVEIGLGIPRETLSLVRGQDRIRMIGNDTNTDYTDRMEAWARARVDQLAALGLDGYVFKEGSPSCGVRDVPLTCEVGTPSSTGTGLFAAALQRRLPELPISEEGWLRDDARRDDFIRRVFDHFRSRTTTPTTSR